MYRVTPDPFIQSPNFWLNYNRYAYCYNNPFSYSDPSGYLFDFIFKAIGAVIGLGQAVVETPLWVIGGSRGENPIERGYATYESFVRIGDDINKSIFGGADAGRDQSLRNIQQPKIRNNGAITIGVNDYDLYQYEENYYTNENGTKSGG